MLSYGISKPQWVNIWCTFYTSLLLYNKIIWWFMVSSKNTIKDPVVLKWYFLRLSYMGLFFNHAMGPPYNTLRPRQNGCHFAEDIFNKNVWFSMKISLKLIPKGPINNISALVQIMAWRWTATSHYLNQWWLDYWCIYASDAYICHSASMS